jgi:hypothetical protein
MNLESLTAVDAAGSRAARFITDFSVTGLDMSSPIALLWTGVWLLALIRLVTVGSII